MGSIGRTGGLSSGIPVDMIGRIPFIVLHDEDHYFSDDDYDDHMDDYDDVDGDIFNFWWDPC